jgi:ferric-dicitrate binding protein FerR (iron transport regulator)
MTCEDCQLACYDLLDRSLSAKDEREVLAHVERCPRCRAFLEEEGGRMRAWPRLLSAATRDAALPPGAAERVAHALEVSRESGLRRRMAAWGRGRRRFRGASRRLALAAAVVVLASLGGALCLTGNRLRKDGPDIEARDAVAEPEQAVRLLGRKQVKGLDIPETLPGRVRLAAGEIVLRLQTGVELTLLGPAEMNIRDGMLVHLERGRLLARVPHWAVGFTVRTRQLEIYDLGTVFGVSMDETGSGVFVFKGSVQVNETGEGAAGTASPGAGVGLCGAGEGVLAKAGERPVRFVADGADAQNLFGEVKGNGAPPCQQPGGHAPAVSACACPSSQKADKATLAGCSLQTAGMAAVTNAQASDLYFSADGSGRAAWDTVEDWRVYQSAGGGVSGRLPSSNDTVRINAATLAAEDGAALVITNGVNAACDSFASGYKDYPGTACLRLEGGTLTSRTTTVIGMYYPGLAVLEGGALHSGTDFYIGGYGSPGGWGVVTNSGAAITALRLHVGHGVNTFGRLAHTGGVLDCQAADARSSLQIGLNGGVGEFEAAAGFSVCAMGIGHRSTASFPLGTGTVTVAEGAVGVINSHVRISNGALFMRGGTLCLQNAAGTLTNLYVRQEADGQAMIRGWGSLTGSDTGMVLRMVNNGMIVADGEGVERDLDFSRFTVVNNDLPGGPNGTGGWYAVNKGRVMFPRTCQSFAAATTYCLGDLHSKPAPELVNSVAFAFSAPVRCSVQGGFYAPDRSDIPDGLPAHLRRVGVWRLDAGSERDTPERAPFARVALTFRYDHTRLNATDGIIRLYRHDGGAWVQVGACLPGGANRISTDAPLAPAASGDAGIGWFALMAAERKGTVFSVH